MVGLLTCDACQWFIASFLENGSRKRLVGMFRNGVEVHTMHTHAKVMCVKNHPLDNIEHLLKWSMIREVIQYTTKYIFQII